MATRNIVPRADGEGGLGTAAKNWNEVRTKRLYLDNDEIIGNDPVGRVVFDVVLRNGYIRADGAAHPSASVNYPRLMAFLDTYPELLAEDAAAYAANVGLYLYDSGTDELSVPNYIGRVMQGGNTVEKKEAGLPNIKGNFDFGNSSGIVTQGDLTSISGTSKGAIKIIAGSYVGRGTNSAGWAVYDFNASRSNSIYSDSINTVQSPAITLIPQIKY